MNFTKHFDCIIVLNGNLENNLDCSQFEDIPIIATDGAANKLLELNIKPTIIIGDFDSFVGADMNNNFEKIKITDQGTYDFEKALLFSINKRYNKCLIWGINGGEYEHSLNNMSVLIKYSEKLDLCVYTAGRYGFYVADSISLDLKKNEIVSIVPCPQAILTTKNLKWELCHTTLELGKNEGARNLAIQERIEIILHSGKYMLFIDSRQPFCY
jgi:thiamine pyrophosphokinase